MKILRLLFFMMLLTVSTAAAQGDTPLGTLEPITASNVERLSELTDLSTGFYGGGSWSSDGQSYYAWIGSVIKRYDLTDPEHPVIVPEESVQEPAPTFRQPFNLKLPVALSPDLSMAAYIVQPDDPEAQQTELHVAKTSDGSTVVDLMTDSPLVQQRYSDDMVLPQFARTGGLLYLREGSLYQWTRETGEETLLIDRQINEKDFKYSDIRLNKQGTYAATYTILPLVSQTNTLSFYDLGTTPARLVFQHEFPAEDRWQSIAISPDGHSVAAGGNGGNIRVWDVQRGGDFFRDDDPPDEYGETGVVDLAYSPDGRTIAGVVQPVSIGYAFVRDAQSGEELVHVSADLNAVRGVSAFDSVAFDPAGKRLALGTGTGTVIVWPVTDMLAAKEVNQADAPIVLAGGTQPVVDVNFSADGTKIAAASWDKTVRVWDTQTRQPIATFNAPDKPWSAVFSPDGNTLAVASDDGSVLLWDLRSQQARTLDKILPQNEYSRVGMAALDFSPDGSLLAGAGRGGGIYLWNVATGERQIYQPDRQAWHLAFSHDGTLLVAASQSDTSVVLWGVPAS